MLKRAISMASKLPITVSDAAWSKMADVLQKSGRSAFVFSAQGGGCNGFNYNLETIDGTLFNSLKDKKSTVMENADTVLVVDKKSEFLLIGTTIDYVKEDYQKGVFESKFIFVPKKEIATSCGCGVSFSPKNL